MDKIESFTDLNTWKEAHKLVVLVYTITKRFPKEETYSLTDQIRRSVISISSNIAEGFSRKGRKEKTQFYFMSKGSITELQNQILVARDVAYLSSDDFSNIAKQSVVVHKLLNGLIKSAVSKS